MIWKVHDEQRLGRAAFLGVTAVGPVVASVGPVRVGGGSGLLPSGVGAVLPQPTSGWRIYTVAATMPRIDPAEYRLRVDGLVQQAFAARPRRPSRSAGRTGRSATSAA
jgi:hypothetical protein